VDAFVPDSAATASALFSGVKVNYGVLSLDGKALKNNRKSEVKAEKVTTLADWATSANMSVGTQVAKVTEFNVN